MEPEGTILQFYLKVLFYNYYFTILPEGTILLFYNLSLLSQLLEKISTKLDPSRKVHHADILVQLGQKGFTNRDLMLKGNL